MLELALLLIIALLVVITIILVHLLKAKAEQLEQLAFAKQSQSVKYGKLTEQFIPFTRQFPFSPENFRFLGSPVDGIVFEDDKIVLCEFKTASSKLSEKQKNIRKLVQAKRVEWLELNVN